MFLLSFDSFHVSPTSVASTKYAFKPSGTEGGMVSMSGSRDADTSWDKAL